MKTAFIFLILISASCASARHYEPIPTQSEMISWRYIDDLLESITFIHNRDAVPACEDFNRAFAEYVEIRVRIGQIVRTDTMEDPELTKSWEKMMLEYREFRKFMDKTTLEVEELEKHLENLPH